MEPLAVLDDLLAITWDAFIILYLYCYAIDKRDFLRRNFLKSLVFVAFYTLYVYTAYILDFWCQPILVSIMAVLVLSIISKANVYASAVSTFVISLIVIAAHTVSVAVYSAISGISIVEAVIRGDIRINSIIIANIILSSGVAALYSAKSPRLFKADFFHKENTIMTYMVIQGMVFVMIAIAYVMSVHSLEDSKWDEILITAISLLYLILIFMDYKERERMLHMESRFKVQQEYAQNMEIMNSVIRGEKHEFLNHLNVILALCSNHCIEAIGRIEAYAGDLAGMMGSSSKLYNTGNNYVDGLLSVKTNFASRNGIHMDVDFDAPLSQVYVDDTDLTSIIGNIIDNAFEALSAKEDRDAVVSVYSYAEGGRFYLSISNNGGSIPPENISKIFDRKFTTKENTSGNHGFGLFITMQLVRKNNGRITVSSTDELTEFLLDFPVISEKEAAAAKES